MRSVISPFCGAIIFSFCAFGFTQSAFGQGSDSLSAGASHVVRFSISNRDTVISLPDQFVIAGSVSVLLDSVRLTRDKAYSLDERFGKIVLHRSQFPFSLPDSPAAHHLTVHYQSFPFTFLDRYRHREPVIRSDSTKGSKGIITRSSKPFSFDDVFGSNLQTNGSIVRGLTVGSSRDLSLNSGFRMQMSGNLSSDLQVIAALTDENTPLQPEGTTQTLQEVDKVFVELRGTNVGATLGDFNLSVAGNEFGGLNRKLQGGKGTVRAGSQNASGEMMVTGATARGKFTTNQLQGIEGVQGPYRLSGQNNERGIIIIAGTERVYLNGERMTRGEINDYTIDYATGEVTFTSRRLVSGASRLTFDFEYSDREFTRNLVGTKVSTKFFDDRIRLNTTIIREGDDQDSPIDAALSDSDKSTLQQAGGDRSKAVRSGVIYVGPGKGQYAARDTFFVNSPNDSVFTRYYRYTPEDSINAVYSIAFSFVGDGAGDYKKVTLTQFEFVGRNGGSYAPVRFLPLPQSTTLYDFDIGAKITDGFQVRGEYAISDFDANRFSTIDDVDKNGSALNLGLAYSAKELHAGSANLGSVEVNFRERYIDRHFVSLDRFNEIEFNRKWNIRDSSKADEELREGSLSYAPVSSLVVSGGIGSVSRGSLFTSHRANGSLRYHQASMPALGYDLEHIGSRNDVQDNAGDWLRQKAVVADSIGHVLPSVRYEGEVLRSSGISSDTLRRESFRFHEISPGVSLLDIGSMQLSAGLAWRVEDSVRQGSLQRASTAVTQQYHWQLRDWNSLASNLDVIVRTRNSAVTDDHLQTILLRAQTHYAPPGRGLESDLFYEVSSERSAKLERVFQRVPVGSGNYMYAGDLNDNHVVDAADFQQARFDGDFIAVTVPTDELIPVTDVKASFRLRLNGFRISAPSGSLAKWLSYFSTEAYARVDEQSSDPDTRQIYLLHFSRFLNDQTTIAGSNIFSDDFYVLENNPVFTCRFRYVQRRGLTQFALQNERTYARERSIRLRWQLIKEFSNQTDYIERRDDLVSTQSSNRVRGINSIGVSTDWSYRPRQEVEVGFRFGMGNAANFDTVEANLNDQSVRVVYSLAERGQVRVEFSREEVTLNKSTSSAPFELTNGKVFGKTWLWHTSTEYRFTKIIQASLLYDGRKEGGHDFVHTVRAEVRAFF